MAFKIGGDDNEQNELSEINIVPLVDVMLVLLIIFMVTAPLSIGGINVALPSSKAKSLTVEEDRIVLSINKDGHYYLDKLKIAPTDLEAKFRNIYANRQKKDLYIRADKGVLYGRVVDAMSAAKLAGVQKLSMLTKSPEGKKK